MLPNYIPDDRRAQPKLRRPQSRSRVSPVTTLSRRDGLTADEPPPTSSSAWTPSAGRPPSPPLPETESHPQAPQRTSAVHTPTSAPPAFPRSNRNDIRSLRPGRIVEP
ncbi:hypothetical protein PVAP13_2NG427900 [Panicum virgatum]|uniref:Uncharacterized protein n=1 Tax=Panicum virgatum TaxID=38727 RepID=A0A8T0VSF4_PANVG|nr:hypothetical protein PVAP13_2NG427900 [Panicum virgatum]